MGGLAIGYKGLVAVFQAGMSRRQIGAVLIAVLLLKAWGTVAWAADPQAYTVSLEQTGDAALDKALNDSSMLLSLREKGPVGPFGLVMRAQEDAARWVTALHSFGFYQGRAELRIAGLAIDDPGLPDLLDRAPAEPAIEVKVKVAPGPLFHIGQVTIEGALPDQARAGIGLASGAAALAPDVLAVRERLLNLLRDQGYALAKVGAPVATLREASRTLDVSYAVDSGPRVDLGALKVKGLSGVNQSFVDRRLSVRAGERFDPSGLEKARQDLLKTGVFASVSVHPAEALDEQGRLPVEFSVRERPEHAVNLGAAYSTDVGGTLSASWQHRNLLGNAETLTVTGGVTQLGGNSTTGIGYNALVSFLKPDFIRRDQALQADLGAAKQSFTAYDREAIFASLLLKRKFTQHWSGDIGLAGEQARITQQGETTDYTLLSLPVTLKYDSTDNLLDPTQGIRAAASLTPIQPLVGQPNSPFVLMQVSGSTYFDLGEPGRSVLALRGLLGDLEGAGQFAVPPDKRFYAGGSATVRGYKYQSIGPQFSDEKPQGGTALAAATVEFRQRILDSYGAVAFVDAGQASAGGSPFAGTWRVGLGVGARYYTSIGPIRLDVAVPVNPQPGSGSFELYIGLGQVF